MGGTQTARRQSTGDGVTPACHILHVFTADSPHHYWSMINFLWCRDSAASVPRTSTFALCFRKRTAPPEYADAARSARIVELTSVCSLSRLLGSCTGTYAVIFHGMFIGSVWLILLRHRKRLRHCAWVVWGGDLQRLVGGQKKRKNVAIFLWRWLPVRAVLKRLGAICALVPGDFASIQTTFKVNGRYRRIIYPLWDDARIRAEERRDDDGRSGRSCRVIVGNSGAPSNRHVHALERLVGLGGTGDLQIICPFGYGAHSSGYAEQVRSYGRAHFGGSFHLVSEMLDARAYDDLLLSADILFFNQIRQQGLYNVYFAMFAGKKLFLAPESPALSMLIGMGFLVFSSSDVASIGRAEFTAPLTPEARERNLALARRHFSEVAVSKDWDELALDIVNGRP